MMTHWSIRSLKPLFFTYLNLYYRLPLNKRQNDYAEQATDRTFLFLVYVGKKASCYQMAVIDVYTVNDHFGHKLQVG